MNTINQAEMPTPDRQTNDAKPKTKVYNALEELLHEFDEAYLGLIQELSKIKSPSN